MGDCFHQPFDIVHGSHFPGQATLDEIWGAPDRVSDYYGQTVVQRLVDNEPPGLAMAAWKYQQVGSVIVPTES